MTAVYDARTRASENGGRSPFCGYANRNLPQPVLRRFYAECDQAGIPREAVEAEAMEPARLRQILTDEIESLIDQRLWRLEQAVEAEEKRSLWELIVGAA